MAGTELSTLANYQDTDYTHEHTYFGNGNGPGFEKSTIGDDYQTSTYDGETQKIGTYYNFQAATIGTGASLTTSGSQAPESFCPVGWQLPIGANQNISKTFYQIKSLYNLISSKDRSFPPSYIFSGHYYWSSGVLGAMGGYGYWWSNTVWGEGNAYNLHNNSEAISSNTHSDMLNGFALRCVSTY